MLNIALPELSACGKEDVVPGKFGFKGKECKNILELIPETEGSSGLVESGSPPNPAA